MKRWGQCLLALCMAVSLCACTATAEELTGEAEGYGGPLKVAVKVENEKITQVRVISHQETEGVGTKAIDALPDAIVAANSTQVDIVSGATYTSRAILAAVDQAMSGGAASPTAQAAATDPTQDGRRTGLGMSALGRLGPGSDADGNPVYSFNVVFCSAAFDAAGRIQEVLFDQLEVTSSNIGDASTLFTDGQLNAVSVLAGMPYSTISEIAASKDIKLLTLEQEAVDALSSQGYLAKTIPAGTYTGQDSDVSTVGVVITVCASADANEAVVYEITKFLNSEEGISILGNVNSGFANYMTGPESGIAGIELELHPGAARYYKEAGVA